MALTKLTRVTDVLIRMFTGETLRTFANAVRGYTGQNVEGFADTLVDLLKYSPPNGTRVVTKGFYSTNDGGAGQWVFSRANLSNQVTSMPLLYRAPTSDPTGASGAWFIDTATDIFPVQYGYGLAGSSKSNNTAILHQICNVFNNRGRTVVLPAGVAEHTALTFTRNPCLRGQFGAVAGLASGTGTVMLFSDADGTADCIRIAPTSGRITGLNLDNITVLSREIFTGGNPTTFKTRTNRIAVSLNFIGGQVSVRNMYIIGFKQGLRVNELWDGTLEGVRVLYCGIESLTPAVWVGSDGTDNSNNLHWIGLHIEFCPFSYDMGVARHISFYGAKVESNRSEDATGYVVRITTGANEVVFNGGMFVQSTFNTPNSFMLNQGRRVSFESCWFSSPDYSSTFKYTGINWYHGNDVNQSANVLANVRFDNVLAVADGTASTSYPLYLGNGESGSIYIQTNNATLFLGCVSLGANCNLHLDLVTSTTVAKSGSLAEFRLDGSTLSVGRNAGARINLLSTGSRNNTVQQSTQVGTVNGVAVPDTQGLRHMLVGASTSGGNQSITGFRGLAGTSFTSTVSQGTVTLVHSSSLVLLTGADTPMVPGRIYTFTTIDGSLYIQS